MDFQQKSSNLEGDNKQGDNNLQGDNRIILALRREITNSYVIRVLIHTRRHLGEGFRKCSAKTNDKI